MQSVIEEASQRPTKTEQPYALLFEALGEIRNALHEKISSLDEHIRRMQLECAENVFQQQRVALTDCVEGIDQRLIKLVV
jgi:hypothetical protein